jgi:hypothetical protein
VRLIKSKGDKGRGNVPGFFIFLITARFDIEKDANPNQPFNQKEQKAGQANAFEPFDHACSED